MSQNFSRSVHISHQNEKKRHYFAEIIKNVDFFRASAMFCITFFSFFFYEFSMFLLHYSFVPKYLILTTAICVLLILIILTCSANFQR